MSQILPLIKRITENSKTKNGDSRIEKFFLFKFAAKSFVVPAVDVTEIVMPGPIISVPQQSDFLMGVVNVRGTVIPVINVRHRIGLEKNYEITDNSRLIIFTVKSGVYLAVAADEVEYRLKEGVIIPLPPELAESNEKYVRSAVVDNKQFHVFLVEQWLDAGEIEILQKVVESF